MVLIGNSLPLRVTVRMDDDVVKHYCNEDTFLIEMEPNGVDAFDVTLIEL